MLSPVLGEAAAPPAQSQGGRHVTSLAADDPDGTPVEKAVVTLTLGDARGATLKRDPYGRDKPRYSAKPEWTVDPLARYLRGVVSQIEANLQNHCLPTTEKLDAFVTRLVANTHRQMKHAPRNVRHPLRGIFERRFKKFWVFARNEKIRPTTPEELKNTLTGLIEALSSEFGAEEHGTLLVQLKAPRAQRRAASQTSTTDAGEPPTFHVNLG